MKKNSFRIILYIIALYVFASFSGCANQQPPSGGEDDKVPPRIKYLFPRPDATDFSGNEITIEFDEYVDRRSFIDAFFVSPKPKGELKYDWSGKSVTVKFEKGLEKNRTYLFVIGKLFKDIRNNTVTEPIQFAISTGHSLDKGKVSGKVFGNSFEKEFVFAYKLTDSTEKDPSKDPPDFIMPVSNDGNYKFENLSNGKYRFFTVFDNDRNGFFDKEFEYISVTEKDVEVKDTIPNTGVNFILKDVLLQSDFYSSKEFYKSLLPDTTGTVYSNISDGDKNVGMMSRIFFYFKNRMVTKDDVAGSSVMQDTLGNKVKLIYNWMNDSLLEVIPTVGLYNNAPLSFKFSYSKNGSERKYKLNFTIAGERKIGEIKGSIADKYKIESPVVIQLINKNKREINFTRTITSDSTFSFPGLIEGTYYIIAFLDSDSDGKYTSGQYYPYKPSEKIIVYSSVLNLKGGWNIENIVLSF
jgi:uncharacterized protein (DUF2141 family)